ncbi:MAG TPA: hypothetical protein VNR40_15780, partial [Steroidobacter sp.]|nr:hypothetical protein [Steroidobacter sp.]
MRTYGTQSTVDTHDFSQLVLPLAGELAMDIAGRQAIVDRSVAAYVEAGSRHDQVSDSVNRSLILDLHPGDLDTRTADRLASRPFLALTPEANNLIDYMGAQLARA